jgi:hypothetical protein
MSFEFINIDDGGEEGLQCSLCVKILSADSMKPNKLKRNLLKQCMLNVLEKYLDFFHRKLN